MSDSNKINTPQDVRLGIFGAIGQYLNQAVNSNMHDRVESMIWSVNDMIPYVSSDSDVNVSSMQFNCDLGGHVFKYSINVNMGEIRIGILIPESLQDKNPILTIDRLDSYDYTSVHSPKKITRQLKNGILLDHIFNNRFASVEVMYKAFYADSKDDKAIRILSDAIAKELIHINHGLMHSFAEKGFLVVKSGIYHENERDLVRLNTSLPKKEILEKLNIQPAQLLSMGEDSYFISLPKSDSELLGKICKMNNINVQE